MSHQRLATVAALVGSLLLVSGCATAPPSKSAGDVPAPTAPPTATTAGARPASSGDPRVLGAATAPVTIVEFTDIQCPYCARFALGTWPELRARYVDTGKVRFVSRDLPLPFHAQALPAAVAARCAGEQGKFWDYRESLFRAQAKLGEATFTAAATHHGLDVASFEQCRKDPRTAAAVREDAQLAASQGIDGTPAFAIGRVENGEFRGEILTGALPMAEFTARIDALLSPGPPQQ